MRELEGLPAFAVYLFGQCNDHRLGRDKCLSFIAELESVLGTGKADNGSAARQSQRYFSAFVLACRTNNGSG